MSLAGPCPSVPVLTEHPTPESGEGPVDAGGVQLGCPLSPRMLQSCHDDAAKFVHLLMSPGGNSLAQEDFIPFLQVRPRLPAAHASHPHLPSAHALAPSSQARPSVYTPGAGGLLRSWLRAAPPDLRERQDGVDSCTPEPAERGVAPSGAGPPMRGRSRFAECSFPDAVLVPVNTILFSAVCYIL
eukprot:bmy_20559T0